MDYEDHSFNHWEFLSEEGVENDAESCDSNHEEGSLPTFRDVIWIVEDKQTLDHGSHKEGE